MKKLILMFAALALVFAFTSCQKEGKFSPNKKISKIYVQTGSSERVIQQAWNWNKNQLESIDHYGMDGIIDYTETFTYSKGRIVRIDDDTNNAYVEYSYKNGKLDRAVYYEHGVVMQDVVYTYKNDKLASSYITYDPAYKDAKSKLDPMRYVLGEDIANIRYHALKNHNTKDAATATETYEWEGDNLVLYKCDDVMQYEVAMSYDKKNSPYYHLLVLWGGNFAYLSKNNAVNRTWTYYSDGQLFDQYNFDYNYTYDGNYPVSYCSPSENGDTYMYFEYEK